jgi:pyruvate dehydrogenase E1 component beta subunit
MSETTYKQAITKALADELAADDSVFLIGEDVGAAGGVFKATDGLFEQFGPSRVYDTPISEQAIVGAAIGAAAMGLRPVAEIMFADFAGVCFDGIANELAKHSQAAENWFLSVPGLKICSPATPEDAYGLMRAAVRDPDPVLYFEHKGLYNLKGTVGDAAAEPTLGSAEVVRPGQDVTIVANQMMRHRALQAADALSADGIEAEVIDPRTLMPMDVPTVIRSVEKTNHLVVVQESPHGGSWGSALVSRVSTEAFEMLDAPPSVVGGLESPIPYAESLEIAWLPSVERIAEAARATVAY